MEHSFFMPLVKALADVHALLGGTKASLAVLHALLWGGLYVCLFWIAKAWLSRLAARIVAIVVSYLATGMLTIGLTFYAMTPAMNALGVAYLSLIWPFWIYVGTGVPGWIAPHLFTFS